MVFAGCWLAATGPLDLKIVLLTMLGSAFVIMSGTCLNNYIDRDLDSLMERTKKRALPAGRLDPNSVLRVGFYLGIAGTIILGTINLLTALLGLLGLFFYVIVYTYWLKRTSTLNTIIGGVSGAMPPIMGYTAISGTMDLTAWVVFLILFLWQPPHFLALAMRRAEDYKIAGFKMLPVVRGYEVTKWHMLRYTAILVPTTLLLYGIHSVGMVYLIGMAALGCAWIALNTAGLFMKDTIKFSRISFVYSLIYLNLFSLLIFIDRV
jgi:protoheme IX farnesyltransferase